MPLKKLRMFPLFLLITSFHQTALAGAIPGPSIINPWETSIESATKSKSTTIGHQHDEQIDIKTQQEAIIKEKASFWGLTVQEWLKFEAINEKGGRGYWSPNLDPLTTLGVEAQTQEERERYAMLLAKKEFERTTKELEFQRVYDTMFKRLYPDVLPVELDDNPNFVAPLNREGQRMVLFVDINDSVRGANLLQKALKTGKEMDVYLLGTNDDDSLIQQWAEIHTVPVERVQDGNITLNHDSGQWMQIGKGVSPILLQEQKSGKWRQIELGDSQ
ncbi:TIGR03759 family integrating conjugative element protein [Orbus sturtevantii]|uniref:TIGR03759 family integrating conjugative element protein n=1 Tax=Orbus sturtevantii TaxID=3074109 RepID=UPI00370D7E85